MKDELKPFFNVIHAQCTEENRVKFFVTLAKLSVLSWHSWKRMNERVNGKTNSFMSQKVVFNTNQSHI